VLGIPPSDLRQGNDCASTPTGCSPKRSSNASVRFEPGVECSPSRHSSCAVSYRKGPAGSIDRRSDTFFGPHTYERLVLIPHHHRQTDWSDRAGCASGISRHVVRRGQSGRYIGVAEG